MAELGINAIFGLNATQDDNFLIIDKKNFSSLGLQRTSNNTAESLLAAIIANASLPLTAERQSLHPEQSIIIQDSLQSLITRENQVYRRIAKTISFDKLDVPPAFNPSDY